MVFTGVNWLGFAHHHCTSLWDHLYASDSNDELITNAYPIKKAKISPNYVQIVSHQGNMIKLY